jgi:hypothetical protein
MVLMFKKLSLLLTIAGATFVWLAAPAQANHAWKTYHWARTSNPFTLEFGDNMSDFWRPYLYNVATDWSRSEALDAAVGVGHTVPIKCEASPGHIEICDEFYGETDWLGIAHIWTKAMHITQGTVMMNNTYFTSPVYDHPAWKNTILCQEIGHLLGLDHQDEDMTNVPLGSCMDYSLWPANNQGPNLHDYWQLEKMYKHPDGKNTAAASDGQGRASNPAPRQWGRQLKRRGNQAIYENDLGSDRKLYTFVVHVSGN